MLLTGMDFLEKKKDMKNCIMELYTSMISVLLSKGLNITPPFFQIVPWLLLDLVWKFHKNPFMRFPVMLLTDKQINQPTEMKT